MNTYIVKLKIISGEFEKQGITLVRADNSLEASKQALVNECHDTLESGRIGFADGGVYDVGGEFYYSVLNCVLVEDAHISILEQYLA